MKNYNDDLMDRWHEGNAAGDGFEVGSEIDTPEQAARREGYEDIEEISPEGNVSCWDGSKLIVICYAHGPWAVEVADETTGCDESPEE